MPKRDSKARLQLIHFMNYVARVGGIFDANTYCLIDLLQLFLAFFGT